MRTIENLLEQHDSYNLGDSWTASRTKSGKWGLYFHGLHVQCWEANFAGKIHPDQLDCFDTISQLLAALNSVKHLRPWDADYLAYQDNHN